MDRVVRHEQPDYEYRPTGLMAEDWGKTGIRSEVTPGIRESVLRTRRDMDNDRSRDSLEYVWSLDDQTLLAGMDEQNETSREICRRLSYDGSWTNPAWVMMMCAEFAYYRGLISETELDHAMNS